MKKFKWIMLLLTFIVLTACSKVQTNESTSESAQVNENTAEQLETKIYTRVDDAEETTFKIQHMKDEVKSIEVITSIIFPDEVREEMKKLSNEELHKSKKEIIQKVKQEQFGDMNNISGVQMNIDIDDKFESMQMNMVIDYDKLDWKAAQLSNLNFIVSNDILDDSQEYVSFKKLVEGIEKNGAKLQK